VATPLSPSVEQSLTHLLQEKMGLELEARDTFNIEVIAPIQDIKNRDNLLAHKTNEGEDPFDNETAEEKKEKEIDDLIDELDKDKIQKQKRMERLFPGIDQKPEEIDPRKEAESSKHLILSRQAFFKNDLNAALNEVITAININPFSSKSYEMLGSIYYRLKWKNLALNNWTKALALDPDNRKLNMFIDKVKNEL
jgi:tetratricopeptide (TPR) repeat protein